jgi:hypothetical protein
MAGEDPGSARQEAERLVAAALAAARLAAADRAGGPLGALGPLGGLLTGVLGQVGAPAAGARSTGFATGSAECCVCPICRAVAALRDPSPEFAERLATGAGDLAAGVASLLRAFAPAGTDQPPGGGTGPAAASTSGEHHTGPAAPATAGPAGPGWPAAAADQVWRAATRTRHDSEPAPGDVWATATRAASDDSAGAAPPADDAGPSETAPPTPAGPDPVVPPARVNRETPAAGHASVDEV